MELIDAHAHLGSAEFDLDREEVLCRAAEAGVCAVVTVGETLEDAQRNLTLGRDYPLIHPTAGLYPTYLDLRQADALIEFIRAEREELVAIGEVGLDYWKVKEADQLEIQREIFGRFVDLSLEVDLPLNVHSRAAGRHAIALLTERGARRVLLHAFDGKASNALPGVESGFYFSVPPSIVRSPQKQKLVRRLPLECLLLETDSPVLGPSRDERNEPANVRVSLQAVAELKDLPLGEVAEITRENARRLFGI